MLTLENSLNRRTTDGVDVRLNFQHDQGVDVVWNDIDFASRHMLGDLDNVSIEKLFAVIPQVLMRVTITSNSAGLTSMLYSSSREATALLPVYLSMTIFLAPKQRRVERFVGVRIFQELHSCGHRFYG